LPTTGLKFHDQFETDVTGETFPITFVNQESVERAKEAATSAQNQFNEIVQLGCTIRRNHTYVTMSVTLD